MQKINLEHGDNDTDPFYSKIQWNSELLDLDSLDVSNHTEHCDIQESLSLASIHFDEEFEEQMKLNKIQIEQNKILKAQKVILLLLLQIIDSSKFF